MSVSLAVLPQILWYIIYDSSILIIILLSSRLIFSQGDEHEYVEHWGEQLVGKSIPVPCVLDVEGGVVSILDNIPDEFSAGPVSKTIMHQLT